MAATLPAAHSEPRFSISHNKIAHRLPSEQLCHGCVSNSCNEDWPQQTLLSVGWVKIIFRQKQLTLDIKPKCVAKRERHSRESNFQAMVMPPISESLNLSRKVPSGLLMSRSWACCLFTKPKMALEQRKSQRVTMPERKLVYSSTD